MNEDVDKLKSLIRDIPDYPRKGIVFKDITPLLKDNECLQLSLDLLAAPFKDKRVTAVLGMESRGFIFGVPVAERIGTGFVPVRKPGKLPAATISQEYALEYGVDKLEIHRDALTTNDNVLIVDDLLATGGTADAVVKLVTSVGASIAGIAVLIELEFLRGREKLSNVNVHSIIKYS